MSTIQITKPDTHTDAPPGVVEPGDHERFSHYIVDEDGKGMAAAKVMEAMVYGYPVKALCGKVWIPTRDPQRYPVCPDCQLAKDTIQGKVQPDA